jgi:GNAT superfamily N-acetyltransferase
MLKIAYATPAEAAKAQTLIQNVSQWLEQRGIGLWQPSQFSDEWVGRHLERGELVVTKQNGAVVGMMLLMLEDAIWDDYPMGEAVFVHKVAVSRDHAGLGVAAALLEFAVSEAGQLGRMFVRLDCALRQPLVDLYEANGFVRLDQRVVGRFTVWRLERRVSPIRARF